MQLIILAGGKGTRLKERLGGLPKPMAVVGGKPLLEHQILLARRHGFDRILLLLGHGAEAIADYCGDGRRWGVHVDYVVEEQPRGTAGAVLAALESLDERFAVMYGDTALNVDLSRFWRSHANVGADVSLLVHPNDHPFDSDLVEVQGDGRIRAFHPLPRARDAYYPTLVNAALYIVEKASLADFRGPLDFARDVFPALLAQGKYLFGYRSSEYIADAGTPERLAAIEQDYASGRIERGAFGVPAPAVFLDRDGTLNHEVGRVSSAEQLELLEGAAAAVRRINRAGYRAVVVTNQPSVARGDCTEATLERIHHKMETLLGREGAYVDGIFSCPHHPDRGFAGERPELKGPCVCRKPSTGLIERARDELNLDLSLSWMIGDSTADIQTARNANVRSILVETGFAGRDGRYQTRPDFVAPTLADAVAIALGPRA